MATETTASQTGVGAANGSAPGDGSSGTPHEIARVRVPARSARGELRAIKVVWKREMIRFSRDRLRILTSLMQPFLFLFVLGTGLSWLASAGTHGVNLRTFVYPGVLCMAVMFTAMFSAASLVWDREFGFLREMMVAPVRRSSLVLGKCLGGATVAAFQGVIVLCLAGLVGVPYAAGLILEVLALSLLLAFAITAFGVMVAARITQMQSFMALMQMAIMPMYFLSGALFPVVGPAAVAGDPQPPRPAHVRRGPDAPRGVRAPEHQRRGAPRAGPGRDVVGLARAGARGGGRGQPAGTGDADGRDRGVRPRRVSS